MALIYPQNGDLTKSLKSARKKVPQSARLSAGGGAKAKRAMPKCPQHEFEEGFPYSSTFFFDTEIRFYSVYVSIDIVNP